MVKQIHAIENKAVCSSVRVLGHVGADDGVSDDEVSQPKGASGQRQGVFSAKRV